MAKRLRSEQLTFRLAAPLRRELEAAAAERCLDLADVVRMVLTDFADKHFFERETQQAA